MLKREKRLAVLLLGICLILLTWVHLTPRTAFSDESIYQQLKLFSDVLNLVQENYVEKVSSEKLMYGAISGMLQELDPHSSFLRPEDYKELQIETKGKFGGIGIEITIRDNILTVVAPLEGTPADRAGIEANDQIIGIDGEPTQEMSLMEAVQKMRGPKGTDVTLTIARKGEQEPLEITLTRDIIVIQSVRSRVLEKGYAYIRVTSFQSGTIEDLQKALQELEEDNFPLQGLVLDLRNNPGGLLDQAVEVSDEFLDEGLIVYTDGRLEGQKMRFEAKTNRQSPHNYPIVVLVNNGSASASEIVAGALQDHKRAVILGEPTFGKGSVQTVIPLNDGSAIRLTTSLYYTPSGRSIQAKGIEPDIVIKRERSGDKGKDSKTSELRRLREKDLPHHMENSQTEKSEEEMEELEQTRKWLEQDNQVKRALELLKSYEIMAQMRTSLVEARK